tara:strand:+ start:3396 stop:17606 length:14211 start_codon:yes stop_codon:yes gene_type:complete
MITTGFDARVKVQQIVDNQLPEFLLSESPKVVEFLKQYYVSQEFRGGTIDIVENLDQYLSLNNLTPDILNDHVGITSDVTASDTIVNVTTTNGFPQQYGLLKIDDEIITYTGITTNSFTGCVRGFSGITSYRDNLNPEELVFTSSTASSHTDGTNIKNLSSLFLKEFYRKIKYLLAPGFEDVSFVSTLDVNNFVKQVRDFYQSKGTEEAFRILFAILYNEVPKIINLEDFLLKPSFAEFIRRRVLVTELISGDPNKLIGQMINNFTNTATGPVSEVEIITRNRKTFYKIQLFSGYNERSLIEGTFTITPNSLVSDSVSIGSSVISVDSTIGFGQTGTVICGDNEIDYTSKSVNQFFGCTGISTAISTRESLYSKTDTIYGYEDGDPSKKVTMRIAGVMSDIENKDSYRLLFEDDIIEVKNLGESIPNNNDNYKQFVFNSWIYNTRTRYEIESFTNNTITLFETPDKSSLKIGDHTDILDRNAEDIVVSDAEVTAISDETVTLDKNITVGSTRQLSIRKRYDYANSTGAQLDSNRIQANVQNTYNENNNNIYVASNSLPDYTIEKNISNSSISIDSSTNLDSIYQGFVPTTGKYSVISFDTDVPFITGDVVTYSGSGDPIVGLEFDRNYYVEVIRDTNPVRTNRIKLYNARSFIGTIQTVQFDKTAFSTATSHVFTLEQQYGKSLKQKNSLTKIPLVTNIQSGTDTPTKTGQVGVLINGVEIHSYKSDDRVYYGPIESIKVLNGGTNYDVINPPIIEISTPSVGSGITAKAQAVVRGSVKEVKVDPQSFSINRVLSTTISGGNGENALLEAVVSKQFREIDFNASRVGVAVTGGIDIINDTLTFEDFHYLVDGQKIVYSSAGNDPLGIGSFDGSNLDQNETLVNGGIYYPQIINTRSIYLYRSIDEYNAGINTVGFTTIGTGGIHRFRTFDEQTIVSEIKVLNPGEGYENRTLKVKPVGISTLNDTITFKNHGFNDGDLIDYTFETSAVSGLSSESQYRILKVDDSNFKLAIAVGGAKTDYERRNYVSFGSTSGEGYQSFSYPPIEIIINAEFSAGVGAGNTIVATPVVRGSIVDTYVYEEGTDYGSNILNFHKNPVVTVKTGLGAQLKPIIKRGRIIAVDVQNGGRLFTAAPDLEIVGDGVGARLRAVVENQRIVRVIILNKGTGYSENKTSIKVKPPGRNVVLESNVRHLRINNLKRFSDELLVEYKDNLSYGVVGYSTDRDGASFLDSNTEDEHSKVIGWANDGNPIYGPYAFDDPNDNNSVTRRIKTGYSESATNIINRPSVDVFELGYFIEDYVFDDSGDLDIHNGRYTKTPEFPNGVYAYFVGVSTNATTGKLDPEFPYFIGDTYRSQVSTEVLDQTFDFNNSDLVRNTFPYRTGKPNSGGDFLFESNSPIQQKTKVTSVSKGSIDGFTIINGGEGYKVGNSLVYDISGTGGGGSAAEVSRVGGQPIKSIATEYLKYEDAILVRETPEIIRLHTSTTHELSDGDVTQISGISTFINGVVGSHIIGVSSEFTRLTQVLTQDTGIGTDIYVSAVSPLIGAGTSIGIGTETLSVLNVFPEENILRVKRGIVGISHTVSDIVEVKNSSITIPLVTEHFNSVKNLDTFFNPFFSVGVGLQTGTSLDINYHLGIAAKTVSVPVQSIYLPNHPFRSNQTVEFRSPNGLDGLPVRTEPGDISFTIPSNGTNQTLYVINKGKDYIGLTTQIGLTTTTNGLYFVSTDEISNNSFEYSLKTTFNEITADIQKIKTQVSISTVHNLKTNDEIELLVKPKLSVGVGTDSSIKVRYDSFYDKILINPVGFGSDKVDIDKDTITIDNHGLRTGQKIFYSASDDVASGLTTSGYFVYRINDNTFKLSKTLNDTKFNPPINVSIASTGGSGQQISLLNPQIEVFKNNNIVFDVSDTSLDEYTFKFFYDKELSNEFVSTGSTSNFSVVEEIVTTGLSTSYTITYNNDLPTKLYYSFEKNGKSIKPDTEVIDYSEIIYVDSKYNSKYKIFGIGATTFNISPSVVPEKLDYDQSEVDNLSYTTDSLTAIGPIADIKVLSAGTNYSRLPIITDIVVGTSSTVGSSAIIRPTTTTIGKLNNFRIVNEGFEYAADKTLRPEASIANLLTLSGSDKIESITVLDGGKNYISAPKLVVVDMFKREQINPSQYALEANFAGNTIVSINIIQEPRGLSSVEHRIFPLRNSNGIQVERILSYTGGIVSLELSTPPIDGFSSPPFKVGDRIFVEGLQRQSVTDDIGNVTTSGNGFNSEENGFNTFRVTEFINSNPAILRYDISEFTNDAGTPVEIQNKFTSIVKEVNLPVFKLNRVTGTFFVGEKLSIGNEEVDLMTTVVENNLIKVVGDYDLKVGDKITGVVSGIPATVESITTFDGRFEVDYSSKKNFGWKNSVGYLNNSFQVLPDNDYYQNLSYTIKSPKTFNETKDFVNKHVHPIGMKNFADTEVIGKANIAIGVSDSFVSPVIDLVSDIRVETIPAYDLVQDYEATETSSRFIIFKNKRLADFIECRTNRVLQIDDISGRFSSAEFNKDDIVETVEYAITDFYSRFLVQVTDDKKQSSQLSEVVVLNDYDNTYTLNKLDLFTDEKLGEFNGDFAASGDTTLVFDPANPNDFNYNIKVYRESFTPTVGAGFTEFGCVRIDARTNSLGPAGGGGLVGFKTDVFRALSGNYDTTYTFAQVLDTDTNRMNYFEVVGHYDGSDTHVSEFYYDTSPLEQFSGQNIGTFGLNVSGGIISLSFENDTSSNLIVKTKTVGIGSTSVGVGTYRYLVDGQIPGTERTAKFDSQIKMITGISTVFQFDTTEQFSQKSIVKVSVGDTTAVHNLTVVADQTRMNIQHSSFISVGTNSGIGTFSQEIDGSIATVKFHPDSEFLSDEISLLSYSQHIYADIDEFNFPEDFTTGTLEESISNAFYGSINDFGKDKKDFDLNYKRVPIFEKTFNPGTSTILNQSTGVFSIDDHFFETGEELIYTPASTLIGVAASSVGIGTTIVNGTIFTGDIVATGFSTVTGIANSEGLAVGSIIFGEGIPTNTTITGISTFDTYFVGDVISAGSSVISGIANTSLIKVGAGIFSGDNTALGSVFAVGINSITASVNIDGGDDRVYFTDTANWSVEMSNVSTATTFRGTHTTGITTDIMPERVYAIRLTKDTFKLTGTAGGSGIGFTFTDSGSGNRHKLEMKKKLEKSLITVDGVTQYPLIYTPLVFDLENNGGGTIGAAVTFLSLSGISSIKPRDILRVDDEFLEIQNVGLGTTNSGPITGIGTVPVIQVERGFVGTAATDHQDGSEARIFKGAYNIVGNKIHFTQAPDGKGNNDRLDASALSLPKSTFNGRVYLRNDYSGNKIYDDISLEFNGIGRTFSIKREGVDTLGLEAGSNLVFINDIFQTPDTTNNVGNNYSFAADEVTGISSVTFTGIKQEGTDNVIINEFDVNQNQIPRGGVIVSLASTGGLGYAPLVGSKVKPFVSAAGTITSLAGVSTFSDKVVSISTSLYDEKTGILQVTTNAPHNLSGSGSQVHLLGLEFSCPSDVVGQVTNAAYTPNTGNLVITIPNHGLVNGDAVKFESNSLTFTCLMDGNTDNKTYPRPNIDPVVNEYLTISNVTTNTFRVNVGASPLVSNDVSAATYNPNTGVLTLTIGAHDLIVGKSIRIDTDSLTFTCAEDSHGSNHTYPRATDPVADTAIDITDVGTTTANITAASYNPSTGVLTITSASHGLSTNDRVQIATNSMTFTCGLDSNATEHTYPRANDPISQKWQKVTVTDTDTFTINVGASGDTSLHTFVTASAGALIMQTGVITMNVGTSSNTTAHTFVSATSGAVKTGGNYGHSFVSATPTAVRTINYTGITTTFFPDGKYGYVFPVNGVTSLTEFGVNVGVSTIKHFYEKGGAMREYYPNLTFGSGYRGNVGVAVTDLAYEHRFVSAGINSITDDANVTYTATNAKYTSQSGVLVLTIPNHGLTVSNTVGIDTGSIVFTCSKDNFKTEHPYPRSTDPVAGTQTAITSVSTNTITVNVGPGGGAGTGANITATVGAGGTLAFNIVSGGSGYVNPLVTVDSPSYEDLPVTGVSRLGLGNTTDVGVGLSMTFEMGPSSVGIGTSHFEVSRYFISKNGYAFRRGDVIKPVGLVTAAGLSEPIDEILFTVEDVFNDSFASWQLGEFDYIDSNASRQDSVRTRFPLFKNGQLLSFERGNSGTSGAVSSLIDFDSILLIYINGVMQEPGVSYTFEGGTTFIFKEAPKKEDKVDVFFYRGTRGEDSSEINVNETIQPGDDLQIFKHNSIPGTVTQDTRIVAAITSADTVETGIYLGDGIDEKFDKPVSWTKQKRDLLIKNNAQSKARDSLEGQVYPTARVIKNFDANDNEIFVDDAQFFNYEENNSDIVIQDISTLLLPELSNPVGAGLTAVVSTAGTITSVQVVDGGSGYTPSSSIAVQIAPPIGGIGTVFKAEIKERVGSVGIGSTVITGIDISQIKIGHFLNKAFLGSVEIIDDTFSVIGITTFNNGQIELNKSVGNSAAVTRTFDFGLYQDQEKAVATTVVSAAGTIASVTLTNPGSGYTTTATPALITKLPDTPKELISGIRFVSGYSGIITGISTADGIGVDRAIRFDLEFEQTDVIDSLQVGYPILISDTTVGVGVTSIDDSDNAVVGIGTTFVDNIYYVHAFTRSNLTGIITANVLSSTNNVGIATTTGSRSNPCGSFSWGRLAGFERGTEAIGVAVSGFTINSGLSTFPILQRRGFGLRDNGSLRKDLG